MLSQVHLLLAYVSAATTALVAAEAGWRAFRDLPAAKTARWLAAGQFASLVATAIAGFALVASGEAANNGLHYLMAVVALLSVPAAPMFSTRAGPRGRALVTCLAGLFALAVVGLLFITG